MPWCVSVSTNQRGKIVTLDYAISLRGCLVFVIVDCNNEPSVFKKWFNDAQKS